ncbi:MULTISPECIES: restriction endonuclease subunit S [unclassified Streptomyces]|uniref:restriction endonuclease subunit S n=1 Tax=unclassified Streptomyces TaxID=2593676 RepID=UPI00081ED96C|nr:MULTISPECIES: restriction endonuclease subunit S [unclassified Streptomyces]MYZ37122.1 restriction endonuclease subunit S [Streptomyces sp. SID4917]SCF88916.1 type I restriction enzyme, S subunit [Streptomyces sp. MnatMP-M17]
MIACRIKDIAYINRRTLAEDTGEDFSFRYIDISSVDSLGNITIPNDEIRFADAPSRARRLAPAGSVIISTVRTYLRAIASVPASDNPLVFSTGFAVLEAGPEVDSRFLAYHCRSQPFIDEVVARSVGVSYPAINASEIGSFPIELKPLEEQRRIADFLDAETARINRLTYLRTQQAKLLTSHGVSRLSELSNGLAERFGEVRLRHLLTHIEQGWSPQCEDRPAEAGEWGVVKAGCVNTGRFDQLQHKALPINTEPRREYRLRLGDLLMSRASGSPKLIGSVGIIRKLESNLLLCDKIYRLSLDQTRANSDFVAHMLRSHQSREHIKNGISGAEGMANNLPTSVVKDCVIPNVPIVLQDQIATDLDRDVEDIERARAVLEHSIMLLAERRQALVSAAVTGQLDVTTARRTIA